ncbi:MAG: DUF418 domain-containing protein [Candidatus Aminicenantes bacterium]|nr:DUF418 domain-containing protein [Candidatus Aminicenantes bacterium]NIM78765.1 DUF418 domain-containing protein [Candidatus Aminicenantes bacterium]NIN18020.1 DUF418 domain-containing protein [Candidatus Aminicenantes bacterium]NIN41920.1 DUF418 domain-containing protein [Candidatus Aminicenantes bacterium]NIN84675.1 DUF418 domain-containing protein [Candidatus Aminicenantes bacterium]
MEKNNSIPVTPTSPSERIVSLDVLRGFALFGILVVNIQAFAMITAALQNPNAFGDLTGLNYVVALFTRVFVQNKFWTIFSLLFGAGIWLMTSKMKEKGKKPAGIHYRRMLWLLLIGLLHAYVLWYGDILFTYALCGLLVYLFRNLSPKKLLIIGLVGICLCSGILGLVEWSLPHWPQEMLEQQLENWQPGEEAIANEIAIYQGGWWKQMEHRVPFTLGFQISSFLIFMLWSAGGLMLIGMAFFKWGILSAKKSKAFYRNMLIIGAVIGVPLVLWGWIISARHNWAFEYAMFKGIQLNYWGSMFLSLAYIAGIMLICQSRLMPRITRSLAAVGRMAFTNYLMHTLICTTLFYGHGFGLFGKINRTGQFLIVVLILAFQMWFSTLWLKHFRFGPFEWLWRSLTYRKFQPMRIAARKSEMMSVEY